MAAKLVTYDLKFPGRNYDPVYDYLRSYGTWARPTESLWLIKTDKAATQIRDELVRQIDQNDKVYVIDITGRESAWAGLGDKVSQWIHDHA